MLISPERADDHPLLSWMPKWITQGASTSPATSSARQHWDDTHFHGRTVVHRTDYFMRLQLKMKSITLRPAKCWSKDGTPKLKKGCCNALSGHGHRAPWSNCGIVIGRGNPKECGQKPVHVAFRKHVIRDWITLQLFLVSCARCFI
jgi:hypothetical protein